MSEPDFERLEREAACAEHGVVSCNVCHHGKCYYCAHDAHRKTGCFEPSPEEVGGVCVCTYEEPKR